ncbi:hypothetical protein ACWIUD_05220 [Helicobacter sp. 23-1044]
MMKRKNLIFCNKIAESTPDSANRTIFGDSAPDSAIPPPRFIKAKNPFWRLLCHFIMKKK